MWNFKNIDWQWIIESITILIVTIVGTSLIFNYLKSKGII